MKYFEVINNEGNLQINDTYKNLFFSRKEKVKVEKHSNPMTGWGSAYYANAYPRSDEVLIAAMPCGANLYGRGFSVTYTGNGTNASARITVAEGRSNDPSPVGEEFEVYYFSIEYQGTDKNNHAGLEVYNASGEVVFSSERKYLIPRYAQFGTMKLLESDVKASDSWLGRLYKKLIDIPQNRKYAVAQALTPWYNWSYNPQTGGEIAVLGFGYKDNAICLYSFPVYNSGGYDLTITAPAGWREMDVRVNYLIVDVTNF
nr:MAG TPA: hypothetical protein [Caudoviricetes sp.]